MTKRAKKPVKITQIRPADENNQVVTIKGGSGTFRKTPCGECPWVKENQGSFPAEAFRHSASTAYDGAINKFACHESGVKNPATCAGFLLRNADNNIGVRISTSVGDIDPDQLKEGDRELYSSYREMAVANGVAPDDPVLAQCRDNNRSYEE